MPLPASPVPEVPDPGHPPIILEPVVGKLFAPKLVISAGLPGSPALLVLVKLVEFAIALKPRPAKGQALIAEAVPPAPAVEAVDVGAPPPPPPFIVNKSPLTIDESGLTAI
jgi:hypothetical protein